MAFCSNPQINFCYLFHSSDLVIFRLKAFRHWASCERNTGYLMNATPPKVLARPF